MPGQVCALTIMSIFYDAQEKPGPRVYRVTSYGADPSGKSDSTEAILKAISDACNGTSQGTLIQGISNLGGAQIFLEGGNYLISKPLRLPAAGVGNFMVGPLPLELFQFCT